MNSQLEAACEAARAGGKILLSKLGRVAAKEKGPADLVTEADVASQEKIQSILLGRFADHAFLGEECTAEEQADAIASGKPTWVVDPLDGTANFVHSLPSFSVSIALAVEGEVVVGVVYDPLSDTIYSASLDSPPMKNGRPVRASGCKSIQDAMVCCSFRPGVKRTDPEVLQFLNVLERSQSLRRLGSAALNLCYLAEGCLDSYWANSVRTWDVAAGYLIASRAGVAFSSINGSAFDVWNPCFVASGSQALQSEMLDSLRL